MRVLVACEYSGVVRDAFIEEGHDAMSCDLLDTERDGPHYKGDIFDIIDNGWDLMIAHPPCTYLCSSGARWLYDARYPNRKQDQLNGLDFFVRLYNSNIPKVCCENPVGVVSRLFRKPDQYIQPYQFGHSCAKKTGLWLKGLPKLLPTNVVEQEWHITSSGKKYDKWWFESSLIPYKERMVFRSRTFEGIAKAMAAQWGKV